MPADYLSEIKNAARQYLDDIRSVRRHLHSNPELSWEEKETADFISGKLTGYGIEHEREVGGHGIVGLISGDRPGEKTVALRADMDALPIEEQNDTPYRSVNSGVMHACGHDVHMASLLGAARILNNLRDRFSGKVKLIFQHAEETAPGGALQMIEAGVLENPKPRAIIGQHVFPELEVGKVGFKSGNYMASSDEIFIHIHGKGGHAAMPEKTDDTVLAAAHVLTALQRIVSRKAPPQIPSVLSFGKVIANGAMNVLPEKVSLFGTFRTFGEDWRHRAHKLIRETAEFTARANGCTCEVEIRVGYPFLVNDDKLTERSRKAAIAYLGKENVVELDIRMTAEDFARYSHHIPACFYRLGTANAAKGITSNLHTPTFDVDERSLEIGAGLLAFLALQELQEK